MADLKIRKPFNGSYPVTFKFGEAPDWYLAFGWGSHNGVDFGLPVGTPVMVVDDGVIHTAHDDPNGFGNYVQVDHSWGRTLYAHLSGIYAFTNAPIKKGEAVGVSGNSGRCTGAHLHFGLKRFVSGGSVLGSWIDPLPFIDFNDESITGGFSVIKLVSGCLCSCCKLRVDCKYVGFKA